jgi:hypothetical protein
MRVVREAAWRCGAASSRWAGSLLNLNCHAHALLPDGVFAAGSVQWLRITRARLRPHELEL